MADNLKNKTAKGLAWGLLNNGTTQVLNLVFGIILARNLLQEDYGIVGVLTVFTLIAGNLQACGFTQGLCNMDKPERRDYNSVFWFNISMSTALYIVLFFSAPLIAAYFRTPELLWLSRFIFLGFWLSSFSITQNAYMFKNMMVKETAIVGFAALLTSGIVGVTLALLDFSYWALAWQQLTYTIVLTIGRFIVSPFRPSLQIDFRPVRQMLPFSIRMMVTTTLNSLSQNILTFIFGGIFTMRIVGNYSQANKWSTMASSMLQGTIYQVAQPVMKEVTGDRERTLRVLRKMMRFAAFASFPAMFGLALVSEEFILCTIGAKWLVAADLLRILAIAGSTIPLYALLQNVAISHGRSDIYMWLNIVQIAVQIGMVVAMRSFAIETIVLAISVFTVAYLFVWHLAVRDLGGGYGILPFLKDIMPFALLSAATMALTYFLTSFIANAPLLLFSRVILAATIYALALFLAKAEILNECLLFISKRKMMKL